MVLEQRPERVPEHVFCHSLNLLDLTSQLMVVACGFVIIELPVTFVIIELPAY